MKKIIGISILLLCIFKLNTQCILDSSQFTLIDVLTGADLSAQTNYYEYSHNGNTEIVNTYSREAISGTKKLIGRTTKITDSNKRLIQESYEYLDFITNTLILDSERKISYNTLGLVEIEDLLTSRYDRSRILYKYDINGDLLSKTHENFILNQWMKFYEEEFGYVKGANNEILTRTQYWDNGPNSSTWQRYDYTFDANGRITKEQWRFNSPGTRGDTIFERGFTTKYTFTASGKKDKESKVQIDYKLNKSYLSQTINYKYDNKDRILEIETCSYQLDSTAYCCKEEYKYFSEGYTRFSLCGEVKELEYYSCNSVQTKNLESKNELLVFPNPASTVIFINLPENEEDILTLQIINSEGIVVENKNILCNSERVYYHIPENLVSGLYYVKLIGKENVSIDNVFIERK